MSNGYSGLLVPFVGPQTQAVGAHTSILTPLGGLARKELDSTVVFVGTKYCVFVVVVIFLQLVSTRAISLLLVCGVAYPLVACSMMELFGR